MSSSPLEKEISWSLSKKIAFRFSFVLLLLYIFCNVNGAFPFLAPVNGYKTDLLHAIIPAFSEHILHYNYDFKIFSNGSGDTSYNWVLLVFIISISILSCVVWSIFDAKRNSYNQAYYWLIVVVRFYLALTLFMYGIIKVIKLQFPDPSLSRLVQPFGDASPMGLAWTFLGLSKGYNMFMGILEISAILLLFRRTTIVGAILALATTVHVMAMNYFFDVPVKQLSTALVVMSLFILAPNFVQLYRFFIKFEPQQLKAPYQQKYKFRWLFYSACIVKYLIIIHSIGFFVNMVITQSRTYGSNAPKPFMYGIYNVETVKFKGKEVPLLLTDSTRWKQMIISWEGYAQVRLMNDSTLNFTTDFQQELRRLSLTSNKQYGENYKFNYNIPDNDHLILKGMKNQDSISISFKRKNLKDFKLINRGFHWINEYPYNR